MELIVKKTYLDTSVLGLGHLLEYEHDGQSCNGGEHQEHVVLEERGHVGKGDGQS